MIIQYWCCFLWAIESYRPLLHVSWALVTLRTLLAFEQHALAVHGDQPSLMQQWQQRLTNLGVWIGDARDSDAGQTVDPHLSFDVRRRADLPIRQALSTIPQPFHSSVHAASVAALIWIKLGCSPGSKID